MDLKSLFSGPNEVEIGSKSGPNQVRGEGPSWVGVGGVGPAGGVPVAPPESLYLKPPFLTPPFAAAQSMRQTLTLPTVPQGHKHRVIDRAKPWRIPWIAEPCGTV